MRHLFQSRPPSPSPSPPPLTHTHKVYLNLFLSKNYSLWDNNKRHDCNSCKIIVRTSTWIQEPYQWGEGGVGLQWRQNLLRLRLRKREESWEAAFGRDAEGLCPGSSVERRACDVCWVESRHVIGILEKGSGLLTGRRGEGNMDWNVDWMRLEDSFSAPFVT